ncbi:Fic family protein [Mycetocola zhadangensis]|uniref:Fic family protein n=1 Tax=Mycetocola zhadangensis TaxID=1164595 RepID=A0A3L7J6B4_9MICO|nr:Fic family protein [Mycetocola zhadangensis]RLQ86183.1 Fic family protein [Mycetocola zhadangensis]GGE89085.1 Fic family protein [Mycetocola zhadangensis]
MSWRAVKYEILEWRRPGLPAVLYEAAIPALIGDLTPELSPDIAALAEGASFELVRLDAELAGNAAVQSLTPLVEAISSSRIEGVVATAGAVLAVELTGVGESDARAVAANRRATLMASNLPTIGGGGMQSVHAELVNGIADENPGEYRSRPVWIGRPGSSPATADFVPPASERIAGATKDLAGFTNRVGIPALTLTAIAHAQYETVHPHGDGNGRVGRALVHPLFRTRGLTRTTVTPLAAGILADPRGYVSALEAYRSGDVEQIVRFFAESILRGVHIARTLRRELTDAQAGLRSRVHARGSSGVWHVLDLLARQPVVTAELLAAHMGIAPTNAYRHLNQLAEAGVITPKHVPRAGTTWVAEDVLTLIDGLIPERRAGHTSPALSNAGARNERQA